MSTFQPTYPSIPGAGLTQINFINTLPCNFNVTYTNFNRYKCIEINATSYSFERELQDQPIEVTAQTTSGSQCGNMNLSLPTWTGTISGDSTKVKYIVAKKENLRSSKAFKIYCFP